MKSIKIHGKDYVLINDRVKYFIENYKGHKINTTLVSLQNGVCVMQASILNEKNEIIATGHGCENQTDGNINKTSYVENCETSAIGRALAFMGIGIDASIASFDEVTNNISNQNNSIPKPNKKPAGTTPTEKFENYNKGVTSDTITEEQQKGLNDMRKYYTENNNTKGLEYLETIKTAETAKKAIELFSIKMAQKVYGDEYEQAEIVSGQQQEQMAIL